MKRSSTVLSIAIASLLSTASHADFVGLNIGAHAWTPDLKGSFQSTTSGSSKIDLNNDLGYSDYSSKGLNISFEHPVPLLPNVKVATNDLKASSTSASSNSLSFDGQTYSNTITSTLDLSHKDVVLYYELLDNWVNLDLGVDLKMFDGKVSMSDSNNTATTSVNVDQTIPMLYVAARFDLPLTGFYVGANIQHLSVGDNTAEDTSFMVGYESKMGLGIEGGVKSFTIELNDANNLNTNLQYDGLYLNGYYHF